MIWGETHHLMKHPYQPCRAFPQFLSTVRLSKSTHLGVTGTQSWTDYTHATLQSPNDLYFWRSPPPKKAFSNQNKGHLGSKYVYNCASNIEDDYTCQISPVRAWVQKSNVYKNKRRRGTMHLANKAKGKLILNSQVKFYPSPFTSTLSVMGADHRTSWQNSDLLGCPGWNFFVLEI